MAGLWPYIEESVSFPSGANASGYPDFWMSTLGRTEGQWSCTRGRQYELDTVLAGAWNGTWRNDDGAFDPSNTSSIYYPQVTSFRAYRRRAQYPITNNKLTAAQATAGAQPNDDGSLVPSGSLPSNVYGNFTPTTSAGSYLCTVPGSSTVNSVLIDVRGFTVTPGGAFSGQATVSKTGSALTVAAFVQWYTAAGVSIGANTGSNVVLSGTGQVVSVSATAPSNAAGARFGLELETSPSGTVNVSMTNWQVEPNGTPSTYGQPGQWLPFITGYVLTWPQDWDNQGTYGISNVTGVDAFGWMSQRKLLSPTYMEVQATESNSLQFLYCLDEQAGSTQFFDATGQQKPIGFVNRGPGVSGFTAVAGATIASLTGVVPEGIPGPVAQISQPATGSGSIVLALTDTTNTWPSTSTGWTRAWACNPSAGAALSTPVMWQLIQSLPLTESTNLGTTYILSGVTTGGFPTLAVSRNGTVLYNVFYASKNVADGAMHRFMVTMSSNGLTVTLFVDGVQALQYTDGSDMRFTPMNGCDLFGTPAAANLNQYSCISQWGVALSGSEVATDYSTFQYGGSGNGNATSATRFQDCLRWSRWLGPQAEDNFTTGQTVNYGPATDLWATFSGASTGTDGQTALNNVVQTENGNGFMSAYGTATLKSRRSRYNVTPSVVFGEHDVASGEIPYTATGFGFDPTRVGNDGQITQQQSNAVTRVYNPQSSSAQTFGDIPITRTANSTYPYELQDYANFLVGKYQFPQQRLIRITIKPSSYTLSGAPSINAWLACLGLEQGDCVQVNRRPPNAPEVTLIGFVEQIVWTMDDATNASVDLQISAYSAQQFWQLGSISTTLHTAIGASGVTNCTINPLADAATNPVQANISSAGQPFEWIIDAGTASAELITITSPNPGSVGYASAILNIGTCMRVDTGATGTGFRFTHSVGAVIQDIGGYAEQSQYTYAGLEAVLTAATLNTYDLCGATTIMGY